MTLADKMTKWGELQRAADALRDEIEREVLALGATQVVGDVRATFSGGRTAYDYRAAWFAYSGGREPDVDFCQVSYDYRAACQAAQLADIPATKSAPTVSLKLKAE